MILENFSWIVLLKIAIGEVFPEVYVKDVMRIILHVSHTLIVASIVPSAIISPIRRSGDV